MLKEVEEVCEYLGKFVVFNYELYSHYDTPTLAEALLQAAFRVCGADRIRMALGEKSVADMEGSKDCVVCMDLIFDTIRGFRSGYKNLNNIYKFSEPACVEKVESYLRQH